MADRPYVDVPVGPLAGAAPAAATAARRWGLPSPVPLRAGMNALFAAGDVVLRVGRPTAPASAAVALADVLRAAGIPAPEPVEASAVEHGDLAVTAWERLDLLDVAPDWRAVGALVAKVHALDPASLPAAYPRPRYDAFPWWRLDEQLAAVADVVDDAARDGLARAIERTRGWAGATDLVVCHGDLHPGNVVVTADGPVLLDWDLLCAGPPQWDHGMLLRVERWGGDPRWYDDLASGYGTSFRGDRLAADIAEARLIAATLLRLQAGRTDEAARTEAQRRLAFWRGDPAAPPWTAQ
ncbi:MAG TPA: aminoglycoside phosphotransferase family protein [Ilumatobacteraceae bacterium]|nr:aminoglycoside phosphotransferase family protein [Ilumatobacteraceae bacterium]